MGEILIRRIGVTMAGTECVVNAANQWLQEGSGVCAAIFREAGSARLAAACNRIGHCDTGDAVITDGFGLDAKYIIHAVGPVWRGGAYGEADKLYSAYKASLELAREHGCGSIAFPLISSGIYGYPLEKAWRTAIRSVKDHLKTHPEWDATVIIAVLDDDIKQVGEKILSEETGSDGDDPLRFTFFWHEYEEYGCLSQWYAAEFTVEGVRYTSCEQYMMAKKALLFSDIAAYARIMGENDPQKCKALGKAVLNFDAEKWNACAEEIVFNGNLAKFSQNPALGTVLLSTGDTIPAEASSYDKIWGIGMCADDPKAGDPSQWKGQNKLGKVLIRVREALKQTQNGR